MVMKDISTFKTMVASIALIEHSNKNSQESSGIILRKKRNIILQFPFFYST